MAGLSDVLSQAKERVKTDVKGEVSRVRYEIKNIKTDAINSVVNAGRGAVSSVVRGGIDGILNAGADLLSGNPQAALDTLMQTPGNILNGIDKSVRGAGGLAGVAINGVLDSLGIGGSRSSLDLRGPSEGFTTESSNGGVNEGNALAGALARTDPLMTFNWYCILPQITDTVYGSVGLPWFYVEEAHVPFRQFQHRTIYREGRTRQYPSRYSVDTLTLGIYLDSGAQTWNYLKAWNAAIIDPFARRDAVIAGGRFNAAYKYKKDIKIFLKDSRNFAVIQLLLSECWPQSIETFNLGSGSSERLYARVTFNVGDVFMDMNPAAVSSQSQGVLPDMTGVGDAAYKPEVFPIPDDSITQSENVNLSDTITVTPL